MVVEKIVIFIVGVTFDAVKLWGLTKLGDPKIFPECPLLP